MLWFGVNSQGKWMIIGTSEIIESGKRYKFDHQVQDAIKKINSGVDHYSTFRGGKFVAGMNWSDRFDVANRLGWNDLAKEILKRWETEVEFQLAIEDLKKFAGL